MVVGQDFDSKSGFSSSLSKGFEVLVESEGSYDASGSPTWRELLQLFNQLGITPGDCFFTNAYMGVRAGKRSTGQFSGAKVPRYRKACQEFFLEQVAVQRPRLVVTLGKWVPEFLADLAPSLEAWSKARSFADIDAAGPVRRGVVFHGQMEACCVVALTHPSYRHANVWRRQYERLSGEDAEIAMMRDALRTAGLNKPARTRRDDDGLSQIEALFHDVIRSRVAEGRLEVPRELPILSLEMLEETERRWFPVAGMYGGFAYQLSRRGHQLLLTAESWSRVLDGSGQRHVITSTEAVLVAEGFV